MADLRCVALASLLAEASRLITVKYDRGLADDETQHLFSIENELSRRKGNV